jgi:outer membrane protein TolC
LLSLFLGISGFGAKDSVQTLVLNCTQFENEVLKKYPILLEKELEIEKQKLNLRNIEMSVLLPKFEIEMGMGPAPGLKFRYDTSYVYNPGGADNTQWIQETHRAYDFWNFSGWGPAFGMEGTVAQPLNVHRYRAGHKAADLNVRITEAEHYKRMMDVSVEAQEIYYGYLLARKMLKEVNKASKDFDEAEEKIEEMLDEEDESVSQKDLLKLKTNRYTLEKGKNEALTGLRRTEMGARFYLNLPDTMEFQAADTVLLKTDLQLPELDTLKLWTLQNHPDLKRLENGLAARGELIKVAKGELGPDLFLFGSFRYTKAWSEKRESGGADVFTRDPLNDLDGAAGLGLRLRLNFWSKYQEYKKQKLELKQLKRTEVYAVKGLLLKLEEAYLGYEEAKANMDAAAGSLRAAEAWLTGAAMDYDLDPKLAKEMISPYKATLLAKEDFFRSVFQYNMAVAKVIRAVGWTRSDYISNVLGEQANIK